MKIQEQYGHFIDGDYVPPNTGRYLDSINPRNGEIFTRIARGDGKDVDLAVASAKGALRDWADMRPTERGKILIDVGRKLRAQIPALGRLEADDMGIPEALATMTLTTAAGYFEYYGGICPILQGDTIPVGPGMHSYTVYEPYGVIGVITPWNIPLNQAARSITPALAAGNTVVHKPANSASLTALVFSQMAVNAGLPKGVWNVVTGQGTEVGVQLARHPDVAKVNLTGSLRAGQALGAIAAEKIMPVTLELGGKSPNIIFEDADVQAAVPGVMMGFLANTGQLCLAGTRILVQRSIYKEFSEALVAAAGQISIGRDKPFPTLGPIANLDQYNSILEYFQIAKADEAVLLLGGDKALVEGEEKGLYIQPTIYGEVNNNMRIAREEIFGPVGVIIPFDTEEEAIEIANDTEFGLTAGIWTRNLSRAHRVAAQIQAGQIYVNYYLESGVEHPLGGYKKSGIGKEKGIMALKECAQMKNICIKLT